MSAQANFFKIGLFVIGGTVALVLLLLILGSGQLFQSKITMETYLNESVQGLEVGSKVRYRGVVVGEVRRIGFTYNVYEQDQPMPVRLRYVMVEATILPRLIGGRAGGDITRPGHGQGRDRPRACAFDSRRRALPGPVISKSTTSIRRQIPCCRSPGRPTISTFRARSRRLPLSSRRFGHHGTTAEARSRKLRWPTSTSCW